MLHVHHLFLVNHLRYIYNINFIHLLRFKFWGQLPSLIMLTSIFTSNILFKLDIESNTFIITHEDSCDWSTTCIIVNCDVIWQYYGLSNCNDTLTYALSISRPLTLSVYTRSFVWVNGFFLPLLTFCNRVVKMHCQSVTLKRSYTNLYNTSISSKKRHKQHKVKKHCFKTRSIDFKLWTRKFSSDS